MAGRRLFRCGPNLISLKGQTQGCESTRRDFLSQRTVLILFSKIRFLVRADLKQSCNFLNFEINLAERGGFEPPVQLLTVQRFSKPPPSATRPPLRAVKMRTVVAGTHCSKSRLTPTAFSPQVGITLLGFNPHDAKNCVH